jgi:cytochrome P450
VTEATLDVSLRIINQALFGEEDLRDLCQPFLDAASDPLLIAPLLMPVLRRTIGPWGRLVRARAALHARIDDVVAARRSAPRADIVDELIRAGFSAEEIRDNLLTLLVAGHETTAYAAAWALHCLHETPATLARIHEEAYLDAVCDETLRLHPVVVQVTRVLREPLGDLPAGATVSPAACLIHRHPSLHQDPEGFRPERFLERRFAPHEHLPFGGGATRCPGAQHGKSAMKKILRGLLQRFSLEPTYQGPVRAVLQGLVMIPDRPLTMRLKAR